MGATHASDRGFPGGASGKEPPANAGNIRDAGSIPGLSRSPEGGCGDPSSILALRIPMDRGAWHAMGHRVTELDNWSNLAHVCEFLGQGDDTLFSLKEH